MRYEFATAGRIIVGPGTHEELPALVKEIGSQALLIHGQGMESRAGPAAALVRQLKQQGLVSDAFPVGVEPDVAMVERGAAASRQLKCDLVIGIGGGSVLDTAKAVAGLATNPGNALDYMEVVGAGKRLSVPPLPVIAVPTTAGTGSEVTRNAVISMPDRQVKVSMRSPGLLPRVALVDSLLTHDLPATVTAASGLDAVTQLMEAYVSRRAQPLTDGFCLEGLDLAAWALRRVYHQPDNGAAREAMSTASLLSGLALANAGLGAVHGIAAVVGGAFKAPHGAACAALLPHVTAANITALRRRDPVSPVLARYGRIAGILFGRAYAGARPAPEDLAACLRELVGELGIPGLFSYGLSTADAPAMAALAARASSTRGNPVDLEPPELEDVILAAL